MAFLCPAIFALVIMLAASGLRLSNCEAMKARVSCLDCSTNYDLSGIKVTLKCGQTKEIATTYTNSQGNYEVEILLGSSSNCLAKLLGGPVQLYSSRGKMVSQIIQDPSSSSSYTTSTPLAFYTKCPLESGKSKYCNNGKTVGSSKTINFPLPREWGLAPSSYYIPFFPIIGIP